jgi:hypothetical protein
MLIRYFPELLSTIFSRHNTKPGACSHKSLYHFLFLDLIMPDVDVIRDILEQTEIAFPGSTFVKSLHQQYLNRGGLSKKQLEGLYQIAQKINSISAGKLSTLEAIILKKPTRYKSDKPDPAPLYKKDETLGTMITSILQKYPQHKRVLFLKTKYDNNEVLTSTEITEIERFHKMLK